MSTVRKVSMTLGLLSLVISAMSAFLIWFLLQTSTHGLPGTPSFPPTSALSAASCESLQEIVAVLTRQATAKYDLNNMYFLNYERLFNFVLLGAIVWGVLNAAGLLFIYRQAGRRVEHG